MMPQQMHGKHFGATEKALALALYEAGQNDTEIGLAIGVSVNNISWWRKEEGLPAQGAPITRPADIDIPISVVAPVNRPAVSPPPEPTGQTDPRLSTPAAAQVAFAGIATPAPDHAVSIGVALGQAVNVDLEELLATRLLIQGNSGSGKSHLLRRLLEQSAGRAQQIVIDPEGDFVGLAKAFDHTVVHAVDHSAARLRSFAGRAREHRISMVLNLDGLDLDGQMSACSSFLGGLFDAPREHWHSALVAVDEAHLFAPSADNGSDPETRKGCLQAMADLMCRGRKRGLAGILATQRLAKLNKNVAAEASNFLMGRTFLDIDIARAADLLGMDRRQADEIRELSRGEFLGLGPAVARRPVKVKIGSVDTAGREAAAQGLQPLPMLSAGEAANLMFADNEEEAPRPALRVVA